MDVLLWGWAASERGGLRVSAQDVVEEQWGWEFTAYWATGPEDGELFTDPSDRSIFIPRSRACMLTNSHAIVIAFRSYPIPMMLLMCLSFSGT